MPRKPTIATHQWLSPNGGHNIGYHAQANDSTLYLGAGKMFLMKHYHTGELEWVRGDALSPYPSEPIEEP